MFSLKVSCVLISTVAACHGFSFDDASLSDSLLMNSQDLGRTFGSFNLSALTGGVTVDGSTILKAALIILLFKILYALALGRNFFGNFGNRAYERVYQNRKDNYYYDDYSEDQFSSRRSEVFQEDLATLMHSLEVAFKKYSVTHIECQMYVACEAGQENRQEENGPLAKIVFDIINQITDRRDFSDEKLSPEMDGIIQSFNYGRQYDSQHYDDVCKPLRQKCFELQNKKNYNYY